MEVRIAGQIAYERVKIADCSVGVLRIGAPDQPVVMFVHGFSGDLLTWQYNLLPLAKDHYVIAIDLPGHGRSEPLVGPQHWRNLVDWVAGLVAALALDRPHLIGHSLGGRLVLGLVENRLVPARSVSLIACAGLGPCHDYPFLKRLASIETLDDARACSRYLFADAGMDLERFARAMHAKLSTAQARAALGSILEANFKSGRLITTAKVDWTQIDCPIQMIWGSDDRVVELPPAELMPPGVDLHVLEGIGHLPQIAAPDRVNRLIGAFVRAQTPQVSRVAAQE